MWEVIGLNATSIGVKMRYKVLIENGREVGVYEDGTIWRAPSGRSGKWEKCIISDNGAGYLSVGVSLKRRYVHRLVATAFLKPPTPEHTQVNHIDGNKSNNHVSNLEWVTPSSNIRHAHKAGLMENRANVGKTIIRPDDDIALLYRDIKLNGLEVAEASRKHGFKRTTTSSIVNKRSRRNVTDEIDKLI